MQKKERVIPVRTFGAKRLLLVKEGGSVSEEERSEVLGVSRVAVVGCGESGCRTLRRIIERTPRCLETVAVADKRQLKKTKASRSVRLEKGLFRQNMPNVCYANVLRSLKEGLATQLNEFDIAFVVAHAESELDFNIASVSLEAMREQGVITAAFVTLPAESPKVQLAKKRVELLRECGADAVVVLDESRILKDLQDVPVPRHRLASSIAADAIKAVSETLLLTNPHHKLIKEILRGLCAPFVKFGMTKNDIFISEKDLLLRVHSDAAGAIVTLTFMFSVGMGLAVEEFNEVVERLVFDALKGAQNAIIDARASNEPLGSYIAKLAGILTGLRWEDFERNYR